MNHKRLLSLKFFEISDSLYVVSRITFSYVWRKGKFEYSTHWKIRHNLLHIKSINYCTKKVYLWYIFLNWFKEAISLIFLVIYKRNLWGFNFSFLRLTSNLFNGKGPHFKTFIKKSSREKQERRKEFCKEDSKKKKKKLSETKASPTNLRVGPWLIQDFCLW